jgi:hypothetical protein
MKKQFLVLLLGLAVFPLSLTAQTAASFQLVSFDIGYAPGWGFEQSEVTIPQTFALNVRVSDSLVAGFQNYSAGNGNLPLFTIKYDFLPGKARGTLAFGAEPATNPVFLQSGGPVAAFGFEYIPFTRNVAGSVTTDFKIGIQYLFATGDVSNSAAVFGITLGIGI